MNQAPHVAIVGATGAVGVEILSCLETRNFPVGSLKLLASARSAGKQVAFRGEMLTVEELTEKSFDAVRAINDKAHIGIVYAGNPSILKRMYGRQEEELDQLYSRVVYKCPLNNCYTLEDIASIYAGVNINRECMQYLYQISKRKGGLRLMVNQCKIAQNLAAALNEDFSMKHLEKAAVRMGIGGAA